MTYLTPNFQNIPTELIAIDRWVIWKGKIPFNPNKPSLKASVKQPKTWGNFKAVKALYEEGNWDGIGFVLTGDGLVGIDIDKCNTDGIPDKIAMSILESLNVKYVEFSPSGKGLRSFGYSSILDRGRRGIVHGINLELYSTGRYLTVTGHTLKNEPMQSLIGFKELAESLDNPTEETEASEETEAIDATNFNISPNVQSADQVINWPNKVIPKKIGQRNQKIFALARWLKGEEQGATSDRQLHVVRQWYLAFRTTIGTDDFGVSWAEFQIAWKKIKYPEGIILKACLDSLKPLPVIDGIEIYGDKAQYLMRVCIALQRHFGADPFFLSARQAGQLCGFHYTHAAAFLQIFADEGWLEIVEKETAVKARRYRLKFKGYEGLGK